MAEKKRKGAEELFVRKIERERERDVRMKSARNDIQISYPR